MAEAGKRRGWFSRQRMLQGRIINVREGLELTPYGELLLYEFELDVAEGQPKVPVRMFGTDFSHRVTAGWVVDVPDPPPHVRPLQPDRIFLVGAGRADNAVVAFYPGRGEISRRRSLFYNLLVLGLPVAFTVAMVALMLYEYNL